MRDTYYLYDKKICNDKRINMKRIPRDKILHFVVSLLLALSVSSIIVQVLPGGIGQRTLAAYLGAFTITIAIGVGKELRDRRQVGNHFCVKDLMADTIGTVVGNLGAFVSYF